MNKPFCRLVIVVSITRKNHLLEDRFKRIASPGTVQVRKWVSSSRKSLPISQAPPGDRTDDMAGVD
jgi:hypothetical protein